MERSEMTVEQRDQIDVVYFTFDHKFQDWVEEGFWDRSAILLKALWKSPRVGRILLVNTPTWVLAADHVRKRREASRSHGGCWFHLEEIDETLSVLHQRRVFPRDRSNRLCLRANRLIHDASLVSTLRAQMAALGLRRVALWLSNPLQASMIGRLGEVASVYDGRDDWSLHPACRNLWGAFERNYQVIARRADLILTVSANLRQRFVGLRGSDDGIHWVPNAVNPDVYEEAGGVPRDLESLDRPILGYVGALQERVNVELLHSVSTAFPQASIVLLGPVLCPDHFDPLRSLPNVHFLGRKDHAVVPGYIKRFDVCLMPHIVTDFTRGMDPLKLYEYFAAGKPTVSIRIPELERFSPYMYVSDDSEEFLRHIGVGLREKGTALCELRRSFARENSWDSRADEVLRLVCGRAAREDDGSESGRMLKVVSGVT